MERNRTTLYILLICLALIVSTVAVYSQVIHFEFLDWDDLKYVTKNTHVHDGLTIDAVIWAFTERHASNWHPLTWMSHMLDCQIFGMDPAGPHVVNVLFHIANALLLFGVLVRMTRRLWPSAFVAALFALHPLHVESVAWVSERKDVLSTFFALLAMWAYVSYVRRGGIGRYLMTALLFALGLLAKPMLVTLPCVFLLLDYWPLTRVQFTAKIEKGAVLPRKARQSPRKRRSRQARKARGKPASKGDPGNQEQIRSRRTAISDAVPLTQRSVQFLVVEKIPLLLLSILSSYATYVAQSKGPAMAAAGAISIQARLSNAVTAYVAYIWKMLWPCGLGPLYTHPNLAGGTPLTALQVGGAVLVLLAITGLVAWTAKRKYMSVGWLWYLGTLVPVIGLVHVGNQAYADRYTYVPLVGLFIIVAWGVTDVAARVKQRRLLLAALLGASAVVILSACTVGSWAQAKHWRTSTTVFERGVEVRPDNPTMHFNLGNMRQADGRTDDAIHQFREAVRIHPYYAKAQFNLGNTLLNEDRAEEAIPHLLQATKSRRNYFRAYRRLGVAYNYAGQYHEAIEAFEQALRIQPNHARANYYFGITLERTRRFSEALEHYRRASRFDPGWEAPRVRAERLAARLGQ